MGETMRSKDILKKVMVWRVISILITLIVTFLYTGNIQESSELTFVLHLLYLPCHYVFERLWEK